jgi:membrane-associated phospholipid phosphatase
LNYINGYHRPFSLTDVTIAYPNKSDIVSIPVVVIVAFVAPAGIIAALNLSSVLMFHDRAEQQRFRRAFWEIHVGCLGLCTGLAATLFVTSGLKDLVGKPRPNLLARCEPDLAHISQFIVGGFGDSLNSEAESLVTGAICQQSDHRLLDDSFAAFPSGHSSFSCAGLVYLSLWLCARFSLGLPYLDLSLNTPLYPSGKRQAAASALDKQAAPPLWQTTLAFAPIVAALFICASRYADFHHAGFDIISGAIIGTVFAWTSFRIYHLPIRRGYGLLAWGPRKRGHAFISGLENNEVPDEERGGVTDYELNTYNTGAPERVPIGGSGQPIMPFRNTSTVRPR